MGPIEPTALSGPEMKQIMLGEIRLPTSIWYQRIPRISQSLRAATRINCSDILHSRAAIGLIDSSSMKIAMTDWSDVSLRIDFYRDTEGFKRGDLVRSAKVDIPRDDENLLHFSTPEIKITLGLLVFHRFFSLFHFFTLSAG